MAQLRYVVLLHEGIADPHFDLMFESAPGSALRTWRSPVWPITEPTQLVELGDHRRAYLEYEGPLSSDRGQVRCVRRGFLSIISTSEAQWRVVLDNPRATLLLTYTSGSWLATPIPM